MPDPAPYDRGHLDVGDDQLVYWETCGRPDGKPAVLCHGGPGSGSQPAWRRFCNPALYRTVLFDQRGCGRSRPHAADPATHLDSNTTAHLVADMERLRTHLGIERWLVMGASWGSTLALAYAEQFPERVTEVVLFAVTTTTRREIEWITRDVGRLFPAAWARFRDGVPEAARAGSLVDAYADLLADPDPMVRHQAALDWCAWEDTHVHLQLDPPPNPRYADPVFRMCFARLVTHYWRHAAWLEEGALLDGAGRLSGIPGVLVHGLLDVSSTLDIPWHLSRAWRGSELMVVEEAGHGATAKMAEAVVAATDRFAERPVR